MDWGYAFMQPYTNRLGFGSSRGFSVPGLSYPNLRRVLIRRSLPDLALAILRTVITVGFHKHPNLRRVQLPLTLMTHCEADSWLGYAWGGLYRSYR